MNDLKIIDNFINDTEFRNYVFSLLSKFNFANPNYDQIDDARLSDGNKINDNDIISTKSNITYTIQTFLNTVITEKEINETIGDMQFEHVSYGVIVTNKEASPEIKSIASKKGIEIIDRNDLIKVLEKEKQL